MHKLHNVSYLQQMQIDNRFLELTNMTNAFSKSDTELHNFQLHHRNYLSIHKLQYKQDTHILITQRKYTHISQIT